MSAVTQWFPLETPPVRIGIYQYCYSFGLIFDARWTGKRFRVADGSFGHGWAIPARPGDQWRGLASNPALLSGRAG
jgi:hypothetical protein